MKTVSYFFITVALSLTVAFSGVCAAAGHDGDAGAGIGTEAFLSAASEQIHSPALDIARESSNYLAGHAKDIIRLRGLGAEAPGGSGGDDYISFSYEGSSGALGFSSGYIYAVDDVDAFGLTGSAFSGEQGGGYQAAGGKNIYVGLDVTHTINLADDVVLDMKAGFIYLNDIYSERKNKAVSLLFVMPLAINNSLTIAPKFHWARYLADYSIASDKKPARENDDLEKKVGSFYGGLSISLAY